SRQRTQACSGTHDDEIGGLMGDGELGENALGDRPGTMTIISATFDNVQFEYDSAHISPSERKKIEEAAGYLSDNPGTGIIVEGHCDERGSREYNMALGERRALAVRAYLVGLGIDGSNIQTKSYGEEDPQQFGHDEDNWRVNRRAEFVFFEQ
ncbi:OmpA family protein, partial [Verrucomicrobiota bacterium]